MYEVHNRMAALLNLAYGGTKVPTMDSIQEPAITCLVAETIFADLSTKYGFDRFDGSNLNSAGYSGLCVRDRHYDGSNYAFMDGHVKWLKKETVEIPRADNKAIIFWWPQ